MRIQGLETRRVSEHTALARRALAAAAAIFIGAMLLPQTAAAQAAEEPTSARPARPGVLPVAAAHLEAGDRANGLRQPLQALEQYQAALQSSPLNYEALWKASGAAIDLAELERDSEKRKLLYEKATDFATRSLRVSPDGAESNFAMARSVGRTALSLGPRDRVKLGKEVRMRALKALAANPAHPGALHVMGVWNAEIMRLSRMSRIIAKTMMGGEVLGTANWAAATSYLEQAVAIDPTRAVHRLDLARVYRDTGRKAAARLSYEAAIRMPLVDANDELYQRQAAEELRALK